MKCFMFRVVCACLYQASLVASLLGYNARTGSSHTSDANHDDDTVYASSRRVDHEAYVRNHPANWRTEDVINRTAFQTSVVLTSGTKSVLAVTGKHTPHGRLTNTARRNGWKKARRLFESREMSRKRIRISQHHSSKLKGDLVDVDRFHRRFPLPKSDRDSQKFHRYFREVVSAIRTGVDMWDRTIHKIVHLAKGDEPDGEILTTAGEDEQGGRTLRETDTGNTITGSSAESEGSAKPVTENHTFKSGIPGNLVVAQHVMAAFDASLVSFLSTITKNKKRQKNSPGNFNSGKGKISITSSNSSLSSENFKNQDSVDYKFEKNTSKINLHQAILKVPLIYIKSVYTRRPLLFHHTSLQPPFNRLHINRNRNRFYYNASSLKLYIPTTLIFKFIPSPTVFKNSPDSSERSAPVVSLGLVGRPEYDTPPRVTKRHPTPPPRALTVEAIGSSELNPLGRSPNTSRKIIRELNPARKRPPRHYSTLGNSSKTLKTPNWQRGPDLRSRTKKFRASLKTRSRHRNPFKRVINENFLHDIAHLDNNLNNNASSIAQLQNTADTNHSEYKSTLGQLHAADYSLRVEIMCLVKSSDEISERLRSQIESLLLTRKDARAIGDGTRGKDHGRRRGRRSSSRRELNMIILLPMTLNLIFNYQRVFGAVEIAIRKVVELQLLPDLHIISDYDDSNCSISDGMNAAIEFYAKKKVDVFVGPVCDYAVAPIARQTRYWKIPLLSPGAMASDYGLHKVSMFPMLTRMGYNMNSFVDFLVQLLNKFGWRRFKTLYEPHGMNNIMDRFCHIAADSAHNLIRVGYPHILNEYKAFRLLDDILGNLHKVLGSEWAVVVMCASPQTVREIMIKAHELNFDNGEYVFFNIDLFSSKNASETPWYRPDDTEERNSKARKAYESLMTVTLRMPTSTEYRQFSNEVKARALEMFPNFTYGEDEVNSFVGAFHDAVLLYALALNETLAENGSISDGDTITKKMWNRTFAGITGNVSIDANGDRNADYSLLDLNPETNKFEVVANYFGNKRKYEPVPNKTIHWAGGRLGPPPDTPTCGFDGSKCPPDEPFPEYGIVIIVLGSILLIVLIAVFFIYRHIKLEAELAEMNWRVRWDDILFGAPEKNKKLERQGSRLSLRKGSLPSDCSGDTIAVHLNDASNRQLFTRTGYYKGAIIAIKPIHRSNITINKPMLLEIKRMKDLQNDHIVRFIGACICFPNSCILTEYCPKGSLQDVLENEQIKLDWMFRYSIMQDIVRGMAYLQGTEIRSHGYLKSTNCVVDSRFVVKITDFGLHHLRGAVRSSEEDENSYSYFHNKLWTAPELLRMAYRPPEGTIKGDVYSFAIICQEIVYRNGVFYLQNMDVSPQEISQKVKLGLKPYFRPTLEEYDCPCDELAGVIKRCWAEDPADRPDFQALKSIIRKLNRDGDKGNILDNLLSRMEQYANNLEALVEERTADYLQQKKKAEDLLYNMLPKKVASQLIRGESVTAEWYDSVSIYFSDICGFTAMSAESTPMEVVDLLNDLYTTFDSIIENFDVYKVETIGDAYMVVSGLPDRNGILHAREIARMSLALLKATVTFRIRHRPKDRLKIRIGIHTGSVCAGVVGLKMPRYCLFGDTVNTASRMESNGLPLKIHVSPQCKEVLDTFGSFDLELRGNVEMKGKGSVKTYWLQGEKTTSDSPGVSLNIL